MEDGFSVLEIFKVAVKNIRIILVVIIVCSLCGFAISFTTKTNYYAKGSVFVMYTDTKDVTTSTNVVTTVNSFVLRDFIIKPMIEELNLEVTIENFCETYSLTSEVDNGFINLRCTSVNQTHNIQIINKVIEKLIGHVTNLIELEVKIMPTEYASYNIEIKHSKSISIVVGFIIGCIISGCIVLYKLFFSPYVQSEDELRRIAATAKITYYNMKNMEFQGLYKEIEDKHVVILESPPLDVIEKLKQTFKINALFLDLENALSIDLERAKEEFRWIFIVSKCKNHFGMEAECVFEFVKIDKLKKKEIFNFTVKQERRTIIGL